MPKPTQKRCKLCSILCAQNHTILGAGSNNAGYIVCNVCYDDMRDATNRRGRRAICIECPDKQKRVVAYTLHQRIQKGRPRASYLCADCLIREVCTTVAHSQMMRLILTDPLIQVYYNKRLHTQRASNGIRICSEDEDTNDPL